MTKTKCFGNLRQLGIAAIIYADDKRFFPHVGRISELDGDYDSNDTPQTFRALMYYGYHDNPEGWVCPASYDLFVPLSRRAQESPRTWFWEGDLVSSEASPFSEANSDPSLRHTSELSYGWTRKGYTGNVRSTALLGVDRAVRTRTSGAEDLTVPAGEVGNHDDGVALLRADATVEWFPTEQPADGEVLKALEDVNLYRASLLVDPASGPKAFRFPEWFQSASVFGGLFGVLGWLYYMGWRRDGARRSRGPSVRATRKRWLTADVDGVGKVDLGAEPAVNAAGKPRVTLSPNQRCPFCHDPLVESDDLVACVACQTLLHRECVQEGGMCSTLGCTNQKKK
jgi:hypothetical protein